MNQEEQAMIHAVAIGVSIAKSVFQVHGVDRTEEVVLRRQLRRGQVLPFFAKQQPCEAEERRGRRRGDLRSGDASHDAVR